MPNNNPNIASDLAFDAKFGLAPHQLHKVGITPARGLDHGFPSPNVLWSREYPGRGVAHAIAPGPRNPSRRAPSDNSTDLLNGVDYARQHRRRGRVDELRAGEFAGEDTFDSSFTTPTGHAGVTFLRLLGDAGSPALWPALSTHVRWRGWHSLSVDGAGNYSANRVGATAVGPERGQCSADYQQGLTIHNGSAVLSRHGMRAGPTWPTMPTRTRASRSTAPPAGRLGRGRRHQRGGAAVAALTAITDQGRALAARARSMASRRCCPHCTACPVRFHDVTSGGNGGFHAGPGYDLVTGEERRSPIS